MRDGRKIKYNLIMGLIGQFLALLLGIVLPKLVITSYGSEVNGLLSSVTNIYACIALVEAGVAGASCQALYATLAKNNKDQVNAVLSATNRYYYRSGLVYLLCIICFSVLYPILIRSDIPYHTVVLVILFNGIGNVINYFFHGKYLVLLKADGKNYIRTGLETFTNSFKQIAKIVLIAMGYDVVFVQLAAMLVSFVQMIYITLYIKKHYDWIDLSVEPDTPAIAQSKNVIAHEINYFVTSNLDTVILTVFRTLKEVSVYSLYALLLGIVNRILRVIRDAVEFKLANLFHTDRPAFLKMFRAFEVYYITLAFSVFSVLNFFILPFIAVYTAGVTDVNYIRSLLPILFVFINLLSAGRYPSEAMIYISGHFKQTQRSASVETWINLLSSVILVHIWGIEGVLLGTILSSLYRAVYLLQYVNRNIIGRSPAPAYLCWFVNIIVFLLTLFINRWIMVELDSYLKIMLFAIPYAAGTFVLYFTVVSVCMRDAFQTAKLLIAKAFLSRNG